MREVIEADRLPTDSRVGYRAKSLDRSMEGLKLMDGYVQLGAARLSEGLFTRRVSARITLASG